MSDSIGTMDNGEPVCGFGKAPGKYRETGYGTLVCIRIISSHSTNKHQVSSTMIYAAQRSTSNTSTGHDDKGWLHPGEFGRVGAWLKRAKRDLMMERERKGLAPSAIFEAREEMYKTVPAIGTPAGMPPPNPATGEAYIRDNFGTPKLNRSINFVEIPLDGDAVAQALDQVTIASGQSFTSGCTTGFSNAFQTNINIWWQMLRKVTLKTCSLKFSD